MLNQMVLVGRAKEIREGEKATVVLSIPRSYKNEDGIYENDDLEITIQQNVKEYLQEGMLIGVKGRIQNNNGVVELIAEKVTFLSSKKENE